MLILYRQFQVVLSSFIIQSFYIEKSNLKNIILSYKQIFNELFHK